MPRHAEKILVSSDSEASVRVGISSSEVPTSSQLGPLPRPGPEAAVEIVRQYHDDSRMFCDSSVAFLRLQRTAVATAVL